ncbi:MAG: DUF1150 domain-containing protein [Lactobacillaceae bacterium]|jgi:hypothetical protein|nr:DUF1150 domain-containing protein [Lactobacillaceae bacterium]
MFITKNHNIIVDEEIDTLMWDDENSAFVKFDADKNKNKWSVYSSDGTKIAEADSKEQAFMFAKQNDYDPYIAH